MDRQALAERLGVHPYGAYWVNAVNLMGWGSDVTFDCLYEPGAPAENISFQIVLNDCRELHWRVYAHLKAMEDRTLPAASLVNIHLGTAGHRKPLHILTDSFGLSVSYGTITIQKVEGAG